MLEIQFEPEISKYDWTYTTPYNGTLNEIATIENSDQLIDKNKLMVKEEILFYEDLILYEDELNDLGVSSCHVKIRIMPSSFLILLRFFLRIDNDRVKIRDTRYFHEFANSYLIREIQWREASLKDYPNIPKHTLLDPNELFHVLPKTFYSNQKIIFE